MNEPIKPPALTADAEAMRRLCANLERGFREAQPALNAWAQHMIDGAEATAHTRHRGGTEYPCGTGREVEAVSGHMRSPTARRLDI